MRPRKCWPRTAKHQLIWVLALTLTLSFGCQTTEPLPEPIRAEDIQTVTAEELHDLIDRNAGKVVIVNFWASWCPPCLEEFPDIIEVYRDLQTDGLEVLAVSMNFEDEMEDVEEFLGNYRPPFPVYRAATVDETFLSGVVEEWFGEIPVTLVFDTSGRLVHFHKRLVTYDELAGEVTILLEAAGDD